MLKKVPARIISITPLDTKIQLNKTSKHYTKYIKINKQVGDKNIEQIKPSARLVVYPEKKQVIYTKYFPDGHAERIVSDEGTRTYYEKVRRGKSFVKKKELMNGIPNMFEWYLNLYDETGKCIKQIIKGVKGSPFDTSTRL